MNAKTEIASSYSSFNSALNDVFHIVSRYSIGKSLRLKHYKLTSYLVMILQEKHSFFYIFPNFVYVFQPTVEYYILNFVN